VAVPGPFFAWLGTTVGGICLFLFLVRRRRVDDAPSLATFVIESAAPVAPAPIVKPPRPVKTPPTDSGKTTETPRRSRNRKVVAPVAPVEEVRVSAFAKPPAKGVERVFVSYRGVQMGATPDELRPTLARLERGDEVEIIDSREGHLNVRTPNGLTGWIPRGTVTGVRPAMPGTSKPATN
jgi:hypothetical protein